LIKLAQVARQPGTTPDNRSPARTTVRAGEQAVRHIVPAQQIPRHPFVRYSTATDNTRTSHSEIPLACRHKADQRHRVASTRLTGCEIPLAMGRPIPLSAGKHQQARNSSRKQTFK
jgi:hypothetical protein